MVKPTSVIIPTEVKKIAKIRAISLGMSFQDYLTDALRYKNNPTQLKKVGTTLHHEKRKV